MFELIRANKRRSAVLVVVMLLILLALGFTLGLAMAPPVDPDYIDPTGGFIGLFVAGVIWIVQSLVAYFKGDSILLAVSGARKIEKEDAPQLFNVVEEMTIAAQLSKMPDIYIIADPSMNAFAAGRSEATAKVAITSGLLERLNRDELQGVIAHEISHIKHRDVLFMTLVGVMVGTIIILSDLFLRTMRYGMFRSSGSRYGSSKRSSGGGNGLQLALIVLAIVLALVAPIVAQLLYFACSRRREYLADAGAAVYTRYPEGLASALEVLSGTNPPLQRANRAVAPMYIVNPLHGMQAWSLHATHPPTADRIRVLRSLAGGVSYAKYVEAWQQVDRGAGVPKSMLAEQAAPIRAADPAAKSAKDVQQRARETGDLLRSVSNFIFIPCVCGMKIKLPPEWKKETATCPRCKRVHTVPVAQLAQAAAAGEILRRQAQPGGFTKDIDDTKPAAGKTPALIQKKRGEWMSFKCPCGTTKNLSPTFDAPQTRCASCGRNIAVEVVDP
ncbi:MAG: M48 family metalloprotease [Candidatus Hydrogenedens sp.]|nr:M48 family metalloprotease [Candidatus Hydrogenedens sp.]